jgi:hypothetical protein
MKISFIKVAMSTFLIAVLILPLFGQESFIAFIEYTEEGKDNPLLENKSRYDVDINSSIEVTFHPVALAFDDNYFLSSPKITQLREELSKIKELLAMARSDLPEYVQSIKSLRLKLVEEYSLELEERFRTMLKAHALLYEKVIEILRPYYEERLIEALGTSDYDDEFSLLAEHINNIQKELYTEALSLIQNNELNLNVWCIHISKGKEPTAIHLSNYDYLEAGSFNIIDKVVIARTKEEDSYLRESIMFHEDLRKFIQDVGDKDSEIRQAFIELREQFFSDLKDFKNLFGSLDLQNLLYEIHEAIKQLVFREEIGALKETSEELLAELGNIFSLMKEHASLVEELYKQRDMSPYILFEMVSDRMSRFDELKNELNKAASSSQINNIKDLVVKFDVSMEGAVTFIPDDLHRKIDEFVKDKSQSWIKSFSNLKKILDKYSIFSFYKDAFEGLVQRVSFVKTIAEKVEPPKDLKPERIRDVALIEAPPTIIDIPRTNRQEGDIYSLYVRVYRKGSLMFGRDYSFRIKKYGTYSRWTGNLIFAKGDWQDSFQPATSISWILHHRSRPKEKNGEIKGGMGIFGNVLNLGIGLNSVVFSIEGDIEYGLGIAVTFLNDILQVGYGINFQREGRRGYFFIGASLFDLLNPTREK